MFKRTISSILAVLVFGLIIGIPVNKAYAAEIECQSWYELPGECLSPSTVDYILEQRNELRDARERARESEQFAADRDAYWSDYLMEVTNGFQSEVDYWKENSAATEQLYIDESARSQRLETRLLVAQARIQDQRDTIRYKNARLEAKNMELRRLRKLVDYYQSR